MPGPQRSQGLRAMVIGPDAPECGTFEVPRQHLPVYEIDSENNERFARGEVAHGDPITFYPNGKSVKLKFGGELRR